MQTIEPTSKVGGITVRVPGAWKVFMRYGIDYCCRGGEPLQAACVERGLDVDVVLRDLHALAGEASPDDEGTRWNARPLEELVEHIVSHYHARHKEELPMLVAMADKVAWVHGAKDERLAALRDEVHGLAAELDAHMMKEEHVLFPMILAGRGAQAGAPIRVMLMEHDDAGTGLERIAELTDGFLSPVGACGTWRALFSGLRDLDEALRLHIHLENNVLFPSALGSSDLR